MARTDKGAVTPAPELEAPLQLVAEVVAAWPGISATSHWHFYDRARVDGIDFHVGEQELGHIHLDGSLHLATSPSLGKDLIAQRLAPPLPYQRGWVCEDVYDIGPKAAIALFCATTSSCGASPKQAAGCWERRLPPDAMNASIQAAKSDFNRAGKMIVVVEDVPDLAEILVLLLESEGYSARSAQSGKAGLALVVELQPDAVLLDHMLPDMTGAEVGVQLRELPTMRNLKILMCTSTPEEVVKPLFDAYDAYLVKPVLSDRLVRTLDAALAQDHIAQ